MHHASPSPQSRWTARRLTVWGTGLLVLSWFIYAYTMSTPGLIDRAGRFKGTDHIYFFVMGSLMGDGRADDLYSPDAHLAEGRRRIDPSLALYAPYSNYGPQIAWAFMPLARLSYAGSLTLFLLFTAACYALAVWLIWRDLPELARYGPLVALLAAASPLFLSLFRYAQLSAITLLLFSLALAAIRRDRRFLAGIALGTMIFKPTLGVLVGITLIAAGEWRIILDEVLVGGLPFAATPVDDLADDQHSQDDPVNPIKIEIKTRSFLLWFSSAGWSTLFTFLILILFAHFPI